MNNNLAKQYNNSFQESSFTNDIVPISVLEECITETVIGQDEAVRSVSTSVYSAHYFNIPCVDLVIGGSGCGKTLLISKICKEMSLPYTIEQSTQYSEEGYIGMDTSDMLAHLFKNSNGDLTKAESGILAIDEICKIKKQCSDKDVSGAGVQDSLLGILSGATIQFHLDKLSRDIPFDTKNLKIFLMGAFEGLDEIRAKRINTKPSIGFSSTPTEKVDNSIPTDGNLRSKYYTNEDLINYGFSAEFVGRIRRIHILNPITVDILVRILKESNESCFLRYENSLMNAAHIKLQYSDNLMVNIAKEVLIANTGARDLERVVNYIFEDIMHTVFSCNRTIKAIHMFDNIVNDNTCYEIIS